MPFIDLNIGGMGGVAGDATVNFIALCPSEIVSGDCVYISGDKTSGLYQVELVDITSLLRSPAIGLVINKPTSTTATVLVTGEVTGVYTGLTPNASYFVDFDGRLTDAVPSEPETGVCLVQHIADAISSDTLVLVHDLGLLRVSG
jgi:hypothetical protein